MKTGNIGRYVKVTMYSFISLLMSVSFVACEEDDDEDKKGFALESFGPSPAMRGGELFFVGRELNMIQSVEFSNGVVVSDLKFENDGKFSITIPMDAEPGKMYLNTPNGKIETMTSVGFKEPITFKGFSQSEILPGAELVINGEYLHSVTLVTFSGNQQAVADSMFIEQTKSLIKLIVPNGAKTGKVCLSDSVGNQVYTEIELAITLPIASSIDKTEGLYPGVDRIKIEGSNLINVESVVFAGGAIVNMSDKDVEVSNESITLTLPNTVSTGEVKMYAYSGVECAVGSISLVEPVIEPFGIQMENGMFTDMSTKYYLGSQVVMKGENLDLVDSFEFGKGKTTDFVVSEDKKSITVNIPESATVDNWTNEFGCVGQMYSGWQNAFIVKMNTKAGMSKMVGILYNEWGEQLWSGWQSGVGGDVTVNGPNPKLAQFVKEGSVTINGEKFPFKKNEDGTITIEKVDSRFGPTCTLACEFTNGVKGSCGVTIVEPENGYLTTIPEEMLAGKLYEFKGQKFSETTEMYFGSEKITDIAVKDATTIYATLPSSLSGEYDIRIKDDKGEYVWPQKVNVVGSLVVVYDGNGTISWDKDKGGAEKGIDITSVSKINIHITWSGPGDGWIGILAQNKAGKDLWSGQKDCSSWSGFDINTGSYKLVVPASEFDMSAEGTIDNTDWFICGGANVEQVKIERITAEY